ncbi:MAG: class I SAM-dependent methyltransferase [bacterium]|nr:class I SAM-dependent methyltransferase [bacterium]
MKDELKKAEEGNKKFWDEVTPVHYKSYNVDEFRSGKSTLDSIQLKDLGNVKGKKLLHLQCHFGLDTLSWVREGAAATGVDFSEKSIKLANRIKAEVGLSAEFICCNIYDLKKHLDKKDEFDIVYTSQGVLCWLKDLKALAELISYYLKPGGFFYIMEGHPFSMVFNNEKEGEMEIHYPYFHSDEPIIEEETYSDYSDRSYFPENPTFEWVWSLSDVFNSLINAGLTIIEFNEHDKLFYRAFPGMVKDEEGWWILPKFRGKIPLNFTLKCRK